MNWTEVRRTARDDVTIAALRQIEPASAMRLSAHLAAPDEDRGWPYYHHGSAGYQQTLLSLKRLELAGHVTRAHGAGIAGSDLWRCITPPVVLDESVLADP